MNNCCRNLLRRIFPLTNPISRPQFHRLASPRLASPRLASPRLASA
ncbi:hypothetical protein CCP4SC76_3010022 [Gammaproteobacteria bacterium]